MNVRFASIPMKFGLVLAAIVFTTTMSVAGPAADYSRATDQADAWFRSQDDAGRITDVHVNATYGSEIYSAVGKINWQTLGVEIYVYDDSQTYVMASGVTSDFQLDINGNYKSATLTGVVRMVDEVSWTSFDVKINLKWSGQGPGQRYSYSSVSNGPDQHMVTQYTSLLQGCNSSGTVSDGSVNYTPVASENSQLIRTTERTLTTTRH